MLSAFAGCAEWVFVAAFIPPRVDIVQLTHIAPPHAFTVGLEFWALLLSTCLLMGKFTNLSEPLPSSANMKNSNMFLILTIK